MGAGNEAIRLCLGDAFAILPKINLPIRAVVTSPPYAEQRKKLYGGIPEDEYPAWTVRWMDAVKPFLEEEGSILINIREHVRDGQISDYVHRTRMAVREAGWIECDELIWIKPDSAPVGHNRRPRRSWERVLWFSKSRQPVCYPMREQSGRIGFESGDAGGTAQWRHAAKKAEMGSQVRCADYCSLGVSHNAQTNHPAAYPVRFAEWMVGLMARPGHTVCDPFLGSGSTALACINLGVGCIGIEKNAKYFAEAVRRCKKAESDKIANSAQCLDSSKKS